MRLNVIYFKTIIIAKYFIVLEGAIIIIAHYCLVKVKVLTLLLILCRLLRIMLNLLSFLQNRIKVIRFLGFHSFLFFILFNKFIMK